MNPLSPWTFYRRHGRRAWQNPHLDPTPAAVIARAEALLRQAVLAVEELEWRLSGAKLRALFDGLVSKMYLSPGEWAGAGAPAKAAHLRGNDGRFRAPGQVEPPRILQVASRSGIPRRNATPLLPTSLE